MSKRLTAHSASPLRREGRDSPVIRKNSKSQIRRLDAKTKLRSNGSLEVLIETTEAESLQNQAAKAADIEHDIAHLSHHYSDFGGYILSTKFLLYFYLMF